MIDYVWLIPLGFAIGAFGTLIGAGGGFILVPVLLLLYPQESPEIITSISLAVVFFNALSGSWAYARMGRIDYRSGWLFAAAAVPGAILGALNTAYIPRSLFNTVFGIILLIMSVVLLFSNGTPNRITHNEQTGHRARSIIEKDGTVHTYHVDMKRGVGLSFFVGYISSLLGIGGGIVHVPVLAYVMNFPVHIATATSHFILAIIALAGTIVHIATGSFTHGIRRTIFLAIGVLIGAQVGAILSSRIHGRWIIRGLAIALGFVGIRILMMTL